MAMAWDSITSVDQSLMLFCWASRKTERLVRHRVVHSVSLAEAKVLKEDMGQELQGLHRQALAVVEHSGLFAR